MGFWFLTFMSDLKHPECILQGFDLLFSLACAEELTFLCNLTWLKSLILLGISLCACPRWSQIAPRGENTERALPECRFMPRSVPHSCVRRQAASCCVRAPVVEHSI